jgi:hypothetical protein
MPIQILEIEAEPEEENEIEVLIYNIHTIGIGRSLVLFRGEDRAPHDYAYELKRRLSRHYEILVTQIPDYLGVNITVSLGAVKACRTKNWNRPIPGQQHSQSARPVRSR